MTVKVIQNCTQSCLYMEINYTCVFRCTDGVSNLYHSCYEDNNNHRENSLHFIMLATRLDFFPKSSSIKQEVGLFFQYNVLKSFGFMQLWMIS